MRNDVVLGRRAHVQEDEVCVCIGCSVPYTANNVGTLTFKLNKRVDGLA